MCVCWRLYRHFPANISQRYLLELVHTHYERGNRWYTGVHDKEDERSSFAARPEKVYIFCQPFARVNLSEILPDLPIPVRRQVTWQMLQGVQALHTSGFIHRDLKLANIGVVCYSQKDGCIQIAILDFGNSVHQTLCHAMPGRVGTIPYLAPEMEIADYDQSVDLWACGIIALQLHVTNGKLKWRHVVSSKAEYLEGKRAYEKQIEVLRTADPSSMENLVTKLLSWHAAGRGTASSALLHRCFCDMRSPRSPSSQADRKKRARSTSDMLNFDAY
jgi:serine/threonine protein kinase